MGSPISSERANRGMNSLAPNNYSTATVFIPAPERGSGGLNGSGWSSWPVRALYAQSRGCSRRPHAARAGVLFREQGGRSLARAGRRAAWHSSCRRVIVPNQHGASGQQKRPPVRRHARAGPRSHRAPTGTPVPAHQGSAKLRSRGNQTPKTIG